MADTVFPYDEDDADPYAADDTKNPHEESESGDEDAAADEEATGEAPRRRPGRPKKNPDA